MSVAVKSGAGLPTWGAAIAAAQTASTPIDTLNIMILFIAFVSLR
jgi:hypothetical protein